MINKILTIRNFRGTRMCLPVDVAYLSTTFSSSTKATAL